MNQINWKQARILLGLPVLAACFVLLFSNVGRQKVLLWELLLVFGYLAALEDLQKRRVPNKLVLAMLGAWVLVVVPGLFVSAEETIGLAVDGLAGFLISGLLFFTVYILSRKGIGGGDVKLMAASGLYLGFSKALPAMLYGSVLAAVTGGVLILLKKMGPKDAIPLVPFLYAGMLLTIFNQ